MSNLILTRKRGETIHIGSNITITILGYQGAQVRVMISAPPEIAVDRGEIRERKQNEQGFNPGEVR